MDEVTKQLISQGIIGVVCVILLLALRMMFKLYVDAQEKRIAEAVDNRTAIERNTNAMTALTEVIKANKG